jgi:hypothetical protein
MAGKVDEISSGTPSDGDGLTERLEKISLGLRRLRTGEERAETLEYQNLGNGHFAVMPKGRSEKRTTD